MTAASTQGHIGVSRLEVVRETLAARGLSEESVTLICGSWTVGTEKQYKGVWTKWTSWCRERQISVLQPSVEQVANFLTESYHDGKSYSTINTYRSAISTTVESISEDRKPIGAHPLISRLLKGIYLLRPPTARYSSTWDVSAVTDYLGTLTSLSTLSLNSLTLKTVMLCALATAQREQTMYALDLRNKIETSESIKFLVTDRLKTSRPGKSVEVCITATNVADICPVRMLREYISRTEVLRLHDGTYQHNLFVSFVKPHNPVTTATIARWIKTVMHAAGIDTTVFKAHSV